MSLTEFLKLSNGKELDIKYPIQLFDKDGNRVYYEDSKGYWGKREYKDGKEVYFENSKGNWSKKEYKDGKEVFFENSSGDKRGTPLQETVEMTLSEVCKVVGKNVKIVKEES